MTNTGHQRSLRDEVEPVAKARARRSARMVGVAAVLGLLVTLAAPASATYPGGNGLIVFNRYGDQGSPIMTTDRSGTVTNLSGPGFFVQPSWSADGRKIVYLKWAEPGLPDYEMWTMNADGSDQTKLTGSGAYSKPSFSPDGRRILFTFGSMNSALYTMPAGGGPLTRVLKGVKGSLSEGVWSPNGRRIAFSRSFNNVQAVWSATPTGSRLRRLTPARLGAGYPDWSPNGRRLVVSGKAGTNYSCDIYRVTARGTGLKRLTATPKGVCAAYARWSPSGGSVVYTQGSDKSSLWVMRADGSHRRVLLRGGNNQYPSWQPR